MYEYNVKVVKIVDGDTVDVDIDLGFGMTYKKQRVRMKGIDTPESRTRDLVEKEKGLKAKARVEELLASTDGNFILYSKGVGKYGRCLGTLFVDDTDINKTLINEGHATEYFGGAR